MDDDEIHPLDRDYSVPIQPAKKRLAGLSRWHHIGFFTFAAGFVTIILAAVVLSVSPSGGWFETIGSFMHRLAMYIILIGGVLIVAAYQAPRRAAASKERQRLESERRVVTLNQEPSVDPTFGSLTLHKDDQIAEFTGKAMMRSGDHVTIGIEIPRDDDGIEFRVRELIEQARQIFLRIREDQNNILALAAGELAKFQKVELQLAANSMDLVWIRFFPDGEAQLVYDISEIFELPWGRRTMHVNVDTHGQFQEGKCAFL